MPGRFDFMSLKNKITEDMKAAMRAKDSARLGTVRLLLAAMKQKEVDERMVLTGTELTDADVLSIIEKMLKQRRESIAQYEKAARQDLANVEKTEIAVLTAYPAAAAFGCGGGEGDRGSHRGGRGCRRQGHGQGNGSAQAQACRPRRHGQGFRAGEVQIAGLKA